MRALIQKLNEELANHSNGTAPRRFRAGVGIVFFPEGRCPFCAGPMKSRLIWRFTETHLKNWWKLVDGKLVYGTGNHPHVLEGTGAICHGAGHPPLSSAAALFLGISTLNPYWSSPSTHPKKWVDWLRDDWSHTCDQLPKVCEFCHHEQEQCAENNKGNRCNMQVGHELPHVRCSVRQNPATYRLEYRHGHSRWLCTCASFENWCGLVHEESQLVCSLRRDHPGINHRACVVGQWDTSERHRLSEWRSCVCVKSGQKCRDTSPAGYTCFKEPGHPGDHVACGAERHRIDTWGCCVRENRCEAEDDDWTCTRHRLHSGPHIACGEPEHNLHSWQCECAIANEQGECGDPDTNSDGWECSRITGHDGDHFGCSGNSHEAESWERCEVCNHDEPECSEGSPYGCTCQRPDGHEGSHIVCSASSHRQEEWDDADCGWCEHGEDECGVSNSAGWTCSREEEHDGTHVACTSSSHELFTWEDEDRPEPSLRPVVDEGQPF